MSNGGGWSVSGVCQDGVWMHVGPAYVPRSPFTSYCELFPMDKVLHFSFLEYFYWGAVHIQENAEILSVQRNECWHMYTFPVVTPTLSLPQKIASCPFPATTSWVFLAQIDLCVLETKPKRIRKHAFECGRLLCPTAHLVGMCIHTFWGFIAERHAIIWIEGNLVTWLSFFLSLCYCEHFCTSCFVDTHFYLGGWL